MAITEKPYTGLTAEIKINNSVVGYLSGFDLTLEKTIIEVLQFGARYNEKVPAIKNWSGSVDGTAAFVAGSSQHKLYQAYENDEEITLGVFLDDDIYFEGRAYISNLNVSGSPDDKINITADFEGNGAVTFTVPEVYLITTHSGVGGTVDPGGSTKKAKTSDFVLTITPATGYVVLKVMDNNTDVTSSVSGNTYTVSNIVADHDILVTFQVSV